MVANVNDTNLDEDKLIPCEILQVAYLQRYFEENTGSIGDIQYGITYVPHISHKMWSFTADFILIP